MKIAIIGSEGFVGKACVHIFKNKAEVFKIDPLLGTKISELPKDLDVALICVPTPMGKDGIINSSIVEMVIEELKPFKDTLIVLKSTVLPNIVDKLAQETERFIYNPEFLTEKNALWDAENPIMTVLGGNSVDIEKMAEIYNKYSICKSAPVHYVSPSEAAFIKYGINSFLSLKVLFFNQFSDLISSTDASYKTIIEALGEDKRIGYSHTSVPGHDGRKGFGSACFSKDVPALIHYSKSLNQELTVLKEAWNQNCEYRNSYGNPLPREIEQHVEFVKIE